MSSDKQTVSDDLRLRTFLLSKRDLLRYFYVPLTLKKIKCVASFREDCEYLRSRLTLFIF